MKTNQLLNEAIELLHDDFKKAGSEFVSARLSAYAFLFGVATYEISEKRAKEMLKLVKEYVAGEEKARGERE